MVSENFNNLNKDYEVFISVIDTGIGMKENEFSLLLNFIDFNKLETGKAENQVGKFGSFNNK